MIFAYSLGPRRRHLSKKRQSSIEIGKLADLTVLSKDIMKIPVPEILTTICVMTVIGGEVVFENR
ncbi:MAG: Amidohydrolase family [Verrucomicrobiota bacterium]